jgi:hypothetical protein
LGEEAILLLQRSQDLLFDVGVKQGGACVRPGRAGALGVAADAAVDGVALPALAVGVAGDLERVPAAGATGLAEVDRVLDQPGDADLRPVLVAARGVDLVLLEEAGELRPGGAGGAPAEGLGDEGGGRLFAEQATVLVARLAPAIRKRPMIRGA